MFLERTARIDARSSAMVGMFGNLRNRIALATAGRVARSSIV
jgi:hypothetical protein